MKTFAQAHGAAQHRIILDEGLAFYELFLSAGPLVATDRPDAAGQVRSSGSEVFSHSVQSLTSRLHEVEVIEDEAGLRKMTAGSCLKSPTHVHDDLCDLAGSCSMESHFVSEGGQALLVLALGGKEQFLGVGIHEVGGIVVVLLGAGFVDHDPAHLTPIFAEWASVT